MQQEEQSLRAALLKQKEEQERAERAELQAWKARMAALHAQVRTVTSATRRTGISLPWQGCRVVSPKPGGQLAAVSESPLLLSRRENRSIPDSVDNSSTSRQKQPSPSCLEPGEAPPRLPALALEQELSQARAIPAPGCCLQGRAGRRAALRAHLFCYRRDVLVFPS